MKLNDAVRAILTTRLSDREIAAAYGHSKTTVGRYRQIAGARGHLDAPEHAGAQGTRSTF